MRAVKAKALRKQVYGDMSHKTREYLAGHKPQVAVLVGPSKEYSRWFNPTCICTGLRRKYQDAKRAAIK